MYNQKIINKENLFFNLNQFEGKKICAMVKSNAYGHGCKQIVKLLEGKVDYYGVANEAEGKFVRRFTKSPILIVGRTENFDICRKYNLECMVDCEEEIEKAVRFGLGDSLHLKINCGMNRFGVKSCFEAKRIDNLLNEKRVMLKSIFTHFPNADNRKQTEKNYQKFVKVMSEVSQKPPLCFGGSNLKNFDFEFDMLRVGIGLYGYGTDNLKPVLSVKSHITKVFYANKGEYIGYGRKYRALKGGFYAIVPIGYGDGLFRGLSGNFSVIIGGKSFQSVGNICMDMFFVKVDKDVYEGQEVVVLSDANVFAKKMKTIPYEVLTNFSKLRAEIKIV